MKTRMLGLGGPPVSAVGLGCMGMSGGYGPPDEAESVRTLHRALDLGINHLDTADMYGLGNNERLVGPVVRQRREEVFLATKFGFRIDGDPADFGNWRIDSSAAWARAACDASLRRLGIDTIDLYYLHRRNPDIPVTETVAGLAELVAAGKVRYLGLSEVSPATVRAAHAIHPIAAVQMQYSLFSRQVVEGELLATCRELGIAVVAYSPVGRGLLTGAVTDRDNLVEADARRAAPWFAAENLDRNLALVAAVRAVAAEIGCTPAQAALAWVLAQGEDFLPIPGTKRVRYLAENAAAAELALSGGQRARLAAAVPPEAVAGARASQQHLTWLGH